MYSIAVHRHKDITTEKDISRSTVYSTKSLEIPVVLQTMEYNCSYKRNEADGALVIGNNL